MPLAGFFCAGEVGPVGGLNFLPTFTTSIPLSRADERGPLRPGILLDSSLSGLRGWPPASG